LEKSNAISIAILFLPSIAIAIFLPVLLTNLTTLYDQPTSTSRSTNRQTNGQTVRQTRTTPTILVQ